MPKDRKKRSRPTTNKQPHGFKDHDKLFKGAFGIREVALLHLQDQLAPSLQTHFNWESFQQSPDSFIEGQLAEYYADIVYTVQFKSGSAARICFLFEHKSTLPDQSIYVQLLQYKVGIWRKNMEQDQALVFVLPVVVYHGVKEWVIEPFFAEFAGVPNAFAHFLPTFDYHLTNISAMPDEMITAKEELGVLRSLFLALKYAMDAGMLKQNFLNILIFADEMGSSITQRLFFERIFEYLQRRTTMSDLELLEIIHNLPDHKKELAMSTYENIIQKGREKGREEGMEKGMEIPIRQYLLRFPMVSDSEVVTLLGVPITLVQRVRASLLERKD